MALGTPEPHPKPPSGLPLLSQGAKFLARPPSGAETTPEGDGPGREWQEEAVVAAHGSRAGWQVGAPLGLRRQGGRAEAPELGREVA